MGKITRYVGMDVHAKTIAVAVVEGRGLPRSLGTIENRPKAVRRLLKKLGEGSNLRVCYEAGPTGYVLYWQLTKLGGRSWCVMDHQRGEFRVRREDSMEAQRMGSWRRDGRHQPGDAERFGTLSELAMREAGFAAIRVFADRWTDDASAHSVSEEAGRRELPQVLAPELKRKNQRRVHSQQASWRASTPGISSQARCRPTI